MAGRGHPIKLCEPTEKAFTQHNVPAWRVTRGTLPTRAATHFVCEKLSKMPGWQCQRKGVLSCQDLLGTQRKQVDLLLHDPDGKVVTIEIAGEADHEVHNALHCLKSEEVRKHVVIAVSQDVMNDAKKAFAAIPELANDRRVEVITLSRALSKDWSP